MPVLVPTVLPMVATDGWGRLAVYEIFGAASILTLPFTLDTEGGLGRVNFSLIGERHGDSILNASKDTESMTVAGPEWDVDGSIGSSGGLVDCFVIGS